MWRGKRCFFSVVVLLFQKIAKESSKKYYHSPFLSSAWCLVLESENGLEETLKIILFQLPAKGKDSFH